MLLDWFAKYLRKSDKVQQTLGCSQAVQLAHQAGQLPFAAMRLQVFHQAGEDTSYMDYDADECESTLHAFMHDMSNLEFEDNWARCW